MDRLIEQLKRHEGFRNHVYKCTAGKNTIGYGRNLDDNGITHDEAEILLQNDIQAVLADLARNIPWYLSLNEARRAVLINMAFNIGINGLMQFKNTLAFIKNGQYSNAAQEMLSSKWARQVGKRAIELSEQMKSGIWTS